VYFKETQTPEEFWNVGPGEQANSEEAIANGAGKNTVPTIIICYFFSTIHFDVYFTLFSTRASPFLSRNC